MSDNTSIFWSGRLICHGHTGWSDPVVYAYDQLERLELIKSAILKIPSKDGEALDFGCGTGDFSKLLLSLGYTVCGYDPFVEPSVDSEKFHYAYTYKGISIEKHSAKLALSVTALDHILDQSEFDTALAAIRSCLCAGGAFLMLEYALDSINDRERFKLKNDYQAFRTVEQWQESLGRNQFRVLEISPAPHPAFNPTFEYIAYSRSLLVKILRRLASLPTNRFWLIPMLKMVAAKYIPNVFTLLGSKNSPLKLIHAVAV